MLVVYISLGTGATAQRDVGARCGCKIRHRYRSLSDSYDRYPGLRKLRFPSACNILYAKGYVLVTHAINH